MFCQLYKETRPSFPLSEFVECFWQMQSDVSRKVSPYQILPNGCIDIIFNFGDLPSHVENDFPQLRSFVVGQMRQPIAIHQGGKVDLLGIRFRVGGAGSFLCVNAATLNNSVRALDDLVGDSVHDLVAQLAEQSFSQRVGRLETLLSLRQPRSSKRIQTVRHISTVIAENHGRVTVDEICRQLEISSRQVERLFAQHVGLSPKLACRILRFTRAVELMECSSNVSWAEFALVCGYYDQSHLIRDFREFAGVTPHQYRAKSQIVAFVQ